MRAARWRGCRRCANEKALRRATAFRVLDAPREPCHHDPPPFHPVPAADFATELSELRQRSLLRKLREIETPPQPDVEFAGRRLVNFASNDYLGLATEPALRDAAKDAIDQFGVGAGSSRLISGTFSPHARLEEKLEMSREEPAPTPNWSIASLAASRNA